MDLVSSVTSLISYPLPAFYFQVSFSGASLLLDTAFQEVSGIGTQIDTEDVAEGGENRFVYQLPTATKHQNLVLKRGVALATSPLVQWCKDTMQGGFAKAITPKSMWVHLLNDLGIPVCTWGFSNAYPVKWEIENFNSTKNEVAIEQVELSYTYSERIV